MNKLFVVESGFTITGSMADHRRAVRPSEIPAVVAAIGAKLGIGSGASISKDVSDFVDVIAKAVAPGGVAEGCFGCGGAAVGADARLQARGSDDQCIDRSRW